MNLLYHHRTAGRGGEGAHIVNIVKAFETYGHKVILVSPPGVDPLKKNADTPLDKANTKTTGITNIWKIISRHAPQLFFELIEISYNLVAIPKLVKAIKQNNIHVIYERSAFFLIAGVYVSRKTNIPLLIEANEAVGIKRARKLILKKIARYCERIAIKNASAIFTVSSYLKKMLDDNSKKSRNIYILPNAIDVTKFSKPTARSQIRKELGIDDKMVMGFIGWFDWWDRLDLLIDIQKELNDAGYHNVITMLIGHGNMVNELKSQIDRLKLNTKVIMTGPIGKECVIDYIDALDIGVLPHSNEFGSPMVLFEMMALGKPVVAPDVEPVKDVITNGYNGLIFKKRQKDTMKANIIKLLENATFRDTIGKNAKKTILEKHTWAKNAETILEILKIITTN